MILKDDKGKTKILLMLIFAPSWAVSDRVGTAPIKFRLLIPDSKRFRSRVDDFSYRPWRSQFLAQQAFYTLQGFSLTPGALGSLLLLRNQIPNPLPPLWRQTQLPHRLANHETTLLVLALVKVQFRAWCQVVLIQSLCKAQLLAILHTDFIIQGTNHDVKYCTVFISACI